MLKQHYFIDEFEIFKFSEVVSTMETAKLYKNKNVIVAETQTGGKGKNNRQWNSPIGNLYFSIVLDTQKNRDYSTLTFLCSVAMKKAIQNFSSEENIIESKWPNDILINKKKAVGILLELNLQDKQLIIGIGVNITSFPINNNVFKATSLNNEKINVTAKDLLTEFLIHFKYLFIDWERNGFKNIRTEWLKNAYNLGNIITINGIEGTFKDLDINGDLIFENNNIEHIRSADIF